MAKNRAYKNVYQITFSGNATNGFTPKHKQEVLITMLEAIRMQWPGDVDLEIIATKGDFNAFTGEVQDA